VERASPVVKIAMAHGGPVQAHGTSRNLLIVVFVQPSWPTLSPRGERTLALHPPNSARALPPAPRLLKINRLRDGRSNNDLPQRSDAP